MGDMPFNDIRRYNVYFYSGALYNVFLKWLESGMKETPQEMAEEICNLIGDKNSFII